MKLKSLRTGLRQVLTVAAMAALLPAMAWAQALTCNGIVTIDYTIGNNFSVPGDVLRVRLTLGTASITGGTALGIARLRFNLDCDSNDPLGLPCTDEGLFVEYEGDATITNTCGKTFTSNVPAGGSATNGIVFTPDTAIVIPANQAVPPGFCIVEFDVKVLAAPSVDLTPNFIEEVGGYTALDAACNNGVLASGGQQSSAIPLCPSCPGTQCTTNACNQVTGQCVPANVPDSTPCGDTDNNACTDAGCEAGQCVQGHLMTVCTPDGDECTEDPPCNPETGLCEHPNVPDSTPCSDADNNACTTPGCEAGDCVQTHITTVCEPDSNECTSDPACNPATGLCEHPPVGDSTPCSDTDSNACTDAGCEAGQCVQGHITTVCEPDTNECTQDPPCNPQTGLCEHPDVPDSTPCTDTDNMSCTTAGCEMGTCVQAHISSCSLFTRTVGFWKNHPALTQSILTNAGGLEVCGKLITDVAVDDAHSALEAMCTPINGISRRQCCRQLMAASLNGAAGGAAFFDLAHCNDVCGDPNSSSGAVQNCINEADDFNGSGDNISLPFSPGPAKSGPCKKAADTDCTIIVPTDCAVQ
jgi:hypothetical protein